MSMTNTKYIYSLIRSYGTHDMYHIVCTDDSSIVVPFKCLSMAVFTKYIRTCIHYSLQQRDSSISAQRIWDRKMTDCSEIQVIIIIRIVCYVMLC